MFILCGSEVGDTVATGGGCGSESGTELEREKGKQISFSICNILNKEEQAEQSDIEESEEEGKIKVKRRDARQNFIRRMVYGLVFKGCFPAGDCDEESEPPDQDGALDPSERLKERLQLEPGLAAAGLPGLPPGFPAVSDPLKSYLSAYSAASGAVSEALVSSAGLVPGLDSRAVIKVPAHRPAALPLPLDYSSPWLYRPLTGLPSYLPLPSSLLLNRFAGQSAGTKNFSQFKNLNEILQYKI